MKKIIINTFIILLFAAGVGILLYPTISNYWNEYRNSQLISSYDKQIGEYSNKDYDRILKEAGEYNNQHKTNIIKYTFEDEEYILSHPYDTLLNPAGNEIMGYINIPKIKQQIAIYHGTGVEALEKGIGHIEGTSLPIGGKGTHAVLSGHRGLPSAKLFTDLDRIEIGDTFYIKVINETLAYKVDQIKTVLPEETDDLKIVKNKDYITLVTCTPYGVNSHRLLVRGIRIPYTEESKEEIKQTESIVNKVDTVTLLIIGVLVFVIVIVIIVIVSKIRKRKKVMANGKVKK